MNNGIIDEIKKRGYWRINIRPRALTQKIQLDECLEKIKDSRVSLRGWSYPYVPFFNDTHREATPGEDHYQVYVISGIHRELWRMYQSTQFIHYLSLWEDWEKEDSFRAEEEASEPGANLSVIGTVYHITEIFEFLKRMIENGFYKEGVKVAISLKNTKGRKLWIRDHRRASFVTDYITSATDINYQEEFSQEGILLKFKDYALNCMSYIFNRFGWHKPNLEVMKADQEALLSRRF